MFIIRPTEVIEKLPLEPFESTWKISYLVRYTSGAKDYLFNPQVHGAPEGVYAN